MTLALPAEQGRIQDFFLGRGVGGVGGVGAPLRNVVTDW